MARPRMTSPASAWRVLGDRLCNGFARVPQLARNTSPESGRSTKQVGCFRLGPIMHYRNRQHPISVGGRGSRSPPHPSPFQGEGVVCGPLGADHHSPLHCLQKGPDMTNRILLTGAAGRIGRTLRDGLAKRYRLLRLLDIAPLGTAGEGEEVVRADIGDLGAMEAALEGIDCVVHLAGVPEEDAWEKILPANIVGTYHVFEAARRRGARRIVFASTNHVVGFHRRERRLDENVMPRPDTRYGVSKAVGA